MNDPHIQDMNSQSMASELSQKFEQAFDQQRALWQQAARFSRDEWLGFTTRRLKHANQVLENVGGEEGFKSLVQAQQAWLRDFVQDYTAQSVRFSETMSRLAATAMARAADAGRDAMAEGQDVIRQGREAAGEHLDTMRQAGAEMMRANQEAVHAGAESMAPSNQEHRQEYH
jgi:hypothetical protein